ncbi:MAG TPA: type I phosphomannose isomerase catalytic subunit, partial [Arthrobacter sp.]|nr:type I phosphomannose isomerase catalytic subunit [Arthrobacter sp.]
MYELQNVLRPYAWGSTTAIAGLLGRPASGQPEAELWIGAHPDSPSVALGPAGAGPRGAHAAVADNGGG